MVLNFKTQKSTANSEIFFSISSTLTGCGLVPLNTYITFFSKISYTCLLSRNTKHINTRFKWTKSKFKLANNSGLLVGFYRALW